MIRLTKEADYGIMLLAYIAAQPVGQVQTAREVAALSGLPPSTEASETEKTEEASTEASETEKA